MDAGPGAGRGAGVELAGVPACAEGPGPPRPLTLALATDGDLEAEESLRHGDERCARREAKVATAIHLEMVARRENICAMNGYSVSAVSSTHSSGVSVYTSVICIVPVKALSDDRSPSHRSDVFGWRGINNDPMYGNTPPGIIK